MELLRPSVHIRTSIEHLGTGVLMDLEDAGRTCYKSHTRITDESARKLLEKIIKDGHHSVVEHQFVSVRIICDRGVTHEIVRHRLASYSQESTRYCDYGNGHMKFIIPPWTGFEPGIYENLFDLDAVQQSEAKSMHINDYYWFNHMMWSEKTYQFQRKHDWSPQMARDTLPNSLKTEIVMTCNLREWRHFFTLRTSSKAHPQMREIAIPLLIAFKQLIPVIFDDINPDLGVYPWETIK